MNKEDNKQIEQCLIDKFTDFTGEEREFVICAISEVRSYSIPSYENGVCKNKSVSFGISIRNHGDSFNEDKGMVIAKSHAINNPFEEFCTYKLYTINYSTIDAHLHSFAELFKRDPSIFITGYKKTEKEYKKDPEEWKARRKFLNDKDKAISLLNNTLKSIKSLSYSKETQSLDVRIL